MNTLQVDLLSLWRTVYSEATQLSEAIERLPDECECGDGDAHLDGRCRCCGGHKQMSERHGSRGNCAGILAGLYADFAMLVKDFSSLAGPIELAAIAKQSVELRRGVFLAASDLQRISEAIEHLDHAVVGFRRTCAVSDLKRVKLLCAELRERCERISAGLENGTFVETT
jgi:hypothetical protein